MDTLVVGTLSVGAVSSALTEFLKKQPWFPQAPMAYRVATAVACLILSAGYAVLTKVPLDASTLVQSFLSYFTATAVYVHAKDL